MNLKPTYNRVIAKGIKDDEKKGGILIPEKFRNTIAPLKRGIISVIGPGRQRDDGSFIPIGFNIGDEITFDLLNSLPFEQDGDEYFMLDAINVLAITDTTITGDNIIQINK